MKRLTLPAYAKINLGLKILPRRMDGYHDLVTILQRVTLEDRLVLETADRTIDYFGPQLTTDQGDNLCVIAAAGFMRRFGEEYGVRISLDKRIPIGAGLGGGSSNAAAVLAGMADLYEISVQNEDLIETAAEVGSDVPFFLSGFSTALAEGRGDVISAVNGLNKNAWLVIIWPGFEISTAWAYRKVDKFLTFDGKNITLLVREFCESADKGYTRILENDFEDPIFDAYPDLKQARDKLAATARFAGLSGSGSALFGVFDGEAPAREAAKEWRSPWVSFVCRPY